MSVHVTANRLLRVAQLGDTDPDTLARLSLERPPLYTSVHREYVDAGDHAKLNSPDIIILAPNHSMSPLTTTVIVTRGANRVIGSLDDFRDPMYIKMSRDCDLLSG